MRQNSMHSSGQKLNESGRQNHFQNHNSQSRSQRTRIFGETSLSSDRKIGSPVSILPVSSQEVVNSQFDELCTLGLQQSQVSEVKLQDLRQPSKSGIPDLSRCKVKFIKRETKETQTGPDEAQIIIQYQKEQILQLQQQLEQFQNSRGTLEFSFHNQNKEKENNQSQQSENQSPLLSNTIYKKPEQQISNSTINQQNTGSYFTLIPNNRGYILKSQNTEKLVQEYSKQKTNKEYFFSQMN